MKRLMRTLLFGALVVAVAAVTVAPVAAGNQVERPHKGSDVGIAVVAPIELCDATGFPVFVCDTDTSGAGIHTHLGNVATSSTGQIAFDVSAPPCELVDGSLLGLLIMGSGTFVFVAANGDEVSGSFTNTICGPPDGSGLVGSLVGTQTITGGTGRFEGATGNVDTLGTVGDDGFELTFNGTITY